MRDSQPLTALHASMTCYGDSFTLLFHSKLLFVIDVFDRSCGLMGRVPGYRSRGPGFDSRRYQISWEVVDLERGPLSLVSTIKELLERKSNGSGPEIR
jgi:hypothetical protein